MTYVGFVEYKLMPNCLRYTWTITVLCYVYEY